jgi:rare lipoprotein A
MMIRLPVLLLILFLVVGSHQSVAGTMTDTLPAAKDTLPVPLVDSTAVTPVTPDSLVVGIASYYADRFEGRRTSNGEIFRQSKLTGAHNTLPLGSWIRVTRLDNGQQVVVRINDRMHPRNQRLVDLSKAAAKKLGYIGLGIVTVSIENLGMTPPPDQ